MYGFHVDLVWATFTHISPMQTTVCDSIVFCYGNATYFVKFHTSPIGYGMVMVRFGPIAIPCNFSPFLWECYVFRKVPYISHRICMVMVWFGPIAIPCNFSPFYGNAMYFVKFHISPIVWYGNVPCNSHIICPSADLIWEWYGLCFQ